MLFGARESDSVVAQGMMIFQLLCAGLLRILRLKSSVLRWVVAKWVFILFCAFFEVK